MVLLILLFCVIFVVFEISKSTKGEDDKDKSYVGDYLKTQKGVVDYDYCCCKCSEYDVEWWIQVMSSSNLLVLVMSELKWWVDLDNELVQVMSEFKWGVQWWDQWWVQLMSSSDKFK